MKRMIIAVLAVLCVSCTAQQNDQKKQSFFQEESGSISSDVPVKKSAYKKDLEHFIQSKLTSPAYGVYTNYKKIENSEELAAGHDVLLESQGLMMQYYLMENNQPNFYNTYEFVKKFLYADGYLRWVYRDEQKAASDVNATIDDLRLIRVLLLGAERFEDASLSRDADRYAKGLFGNNQHRLYNIQTPANRSTDINLCYIDLYTLNMLAKNNSDYLRTYDTMKSILESGYISDAFPFYYKAYDYQQYEKGEVNVIELLISVLHLAEVGLARENTVDFLRKLVDGNTLYATWDTGLGQPVNEYTSTAAYAIASMIFLHIGDNAYYDKCIEKMDLHRSNDPASPVYGAFGTASQLYSFDNLYAILAYSASEHLEFF